MCRIYPFQSTPLKTCLGGCGWYKLESNRGMCLAQNNAWARHEFGSYNLDGGFESFWKFNPKHFCRVLMRLDQQFRGCFYLVDMS